MRSSRKCYAWAIFLAVLGACAYEAAAGAANAASAEASRLKEGLEKVGIAESCQIVVADERDIVEDTAAQMLQRFLDKASIKADIVRESEATGEKHFLLGRDANSAAIRTLGDKGDIHIREVSPEDDGFHLKQIGKQIIVAGANPRGVLYGVYAFEDFINGEATGKLDIKKVPYYRKRGTGLYLIDVAWGAPLKPIPEETAICLSRLGINQMTEQGIGGALSKSVTSDVFPFLPPPDPEYQKQVKAMSKLFRRFGIDMYALVVEPAMFPINGSYDSYPKEALGLTRRSLDWGASGEGLAPTLCVSSPLGQKYLRDMMRRFVREYPDMKGAYFYDLDVHSWLCMPGLCERCKQVCTDSPPDSGTPWETQAELVTLLADAAHEERPDFEFLFWGAVHFAEEPLKKRIKPPKATTAY